MYICINPDQFRRVKHLYMKSKITIEFDENNTPCIDIKYEPSDDVRDKMIRKFMATCACIESGLVKIHTAQMSENGSRITRITPITMERMQDEVHTMDVWLKSLEK